MAKAQFYPKTIFVTLENAGEYDAYHLVNGTAEEALEATDGCTVAEYSLVKVRRGKLVPEWES